MKKYIALLRGINVGGKNKIAMSELKLGFKDVGYKEVVTYINSGNVIFETDEKNLSVIRNTCEKLVSEKFELDIPIAIVPVEQLGRILENQPDWWNVNKDDINYAIFVLDPATPTEVVDILGEPKEEYETLKYYENMLFWTCERCNFNKTKWSKIASSKANSLVTIRNANTMNKLYELSNK